MESLEVHGKTVEEATLKGLQQLGLSRAEAEVTVIREGRAGIFGLGAEDAIVRITSLKEQAEETPRTGDAEKVARESLEKLLELLGVEGTVEVQKGAEVPTGEEGEGSPVLLDIKGEDLGILIGRRGQTLAALQYVLRLVVGRKIETWSPIVVDVEGYKQRRARALRTLALDMAERVKARGAPFTLEPMPPAERRIIHLALANHNGVTTESIGQGEARKVVIRPKKK